MGSLFQPKLEKPPPLPPAALPPTLATTAQKITGDSARTRAAQAFGGTVKNTGGQGGLTMPTSVATTSLLG